jgi:dolichol-phosphate mannosyltransferase
MRVGEHCARIRSAQNRRGLVMPFSPEVRGALPTDALFRSSDHRPPRGESEIVAANPDLNHVRPDLTVIIPTRDETENIEPLLDRLLPALAPAAVEVLFVDDSDDDTVAEICRVGRDLEVPVRVLHREPGQRDGGLSTAVIAGMKAARGRWALVMDADLQHPPEIAPQLFLTARRQQVDLVVASRYAGHGNSAGLDGGTRRGSSKFATRITKLAFPRRSSRLSDPMSGFFVVRLDVLDLDRLRPYGYKILLELVVRTPDLRIAEVTYAFQARHAGESKTSLREGLNFARHLARLRLQIARERDAATRARPGARKRVILFGLVGLSGIAVNSAALWLFHLEAFQLHYLVAATLATQVSTLWNFVFTDQLVFRTARDGRRWGRLWRFFALNNGALLLRLPMLWVLVHLGVPVIPANVLTLLALFVVRYLVSDRLIFGRPARSVEPQIERPMLEPVKRLVDLAADGSTLDRAKPKRIRYLPYRYDVAGLVTLGSQVPLPELDYFRAHWLDGDTDIAIRVGDVGRSMPIPRAVVTQFVNPQALRYEEHLGRLGANFRIDLGSTIDVTVGPLLARSPHVVYTNIVEALLRFVIADRGRMLLHAACLELDDRGVLLSARTDTGKTGTILRLLREQGGRFLSDDMTVIDEGGTALCFPKPLTISQHTLRAVNAGDLSPAEWRRLRVQSRLHSKEGRSLAMVLARYNMPIMAINAITQIVVPPPKYNVDRLVPCRTKASTSVRELFLIERGADRISGVTTAQAVDELMANTADAYGFPPFQYLAPAIVLGDGGYTELLQRERAILVSAVERMHKRRVASSSFGWADEIPRLLDHNGHEVLAHNGHEVNGAAEIPRRRLPLMVRETRPRSAPEETLTSVEDPAVVRD